MSATGVIVWGTGGHARVVSEIIELTDGCEVAGYLDDFARTDTFLDRPIFGGRDRLPELLAHGLNEFVVAIGNCNVRLEAVRHGLSLGWQSRVWVHPRSSVSAHAKIGPGTVICPGAVVSTHAELGAGCIVNTMASVDHDCRLADGVHICPGAHLAGDVHVGEGSWIGIGSSVVEGKKIGSGVLIGAGSVVNRNIPDGVKAWGIPARVQKGV
ncbi:acetyltransferase [Rubinisphaera margarita]|uniref:acetyltransferase n=1 Tax=Rubinisphaera margarita TaxID=2909586 RepID=UPI001EE8A855|nr:acetyltransferase [Rubinisphaera margarita]MCG6155856.1 acetyltransferase [Rubinisphaera margarita]